jgi:hypothetical protein
MVAYALTSTAARGQAPYLTPAEYLAAPSGVDAGALIAGDARGSAGALLAVLRRASSWADTLCDQVLAATTDTEAGRFRVARDGILRVHPRYTPVVAVTAFSYGLAGSASTALSDLSALWVEDGQFAVPLLGARSWQGSLDFAGARLAPGAEAYCQWTYVNGFPNTLLSAATTAGATSLTVTDGTGLVPGKTALTVYDGGATETVKVAASYTFASTTVPLTAALAFDHPQAGVSVTGMPDVIKQAVTLLTSALIKTRSAASITMSSTGDRPDRKTSKTAGAIDESEVAAAMLAPFARVR